MKQKKQILNAQELVDSIKKGLRSKKIWKSGQIEYQTPEKKSELELLKQKIELALITARDYQDPLFIFPRNPLARLIKRGILRIMRVFTKYQIAYNKNVVYLLDDLYKYLQILEKKINEKNSTN